MNDALLDDLKQFIEAKFSQAEARNGERFDAIDKRFASIDTRFDQLDEKIDVLRQEMHDGFAGVADAMEETNKVVDARLTNLEQRVGVA